ncbi:MAG: class IIb bacteriocin, lactobin A/cerein 7B family [Defluviitaleaceae bacterium]|nr:class IIb bacteriocin, lactobin A/cerein 7B family [Defluviitaleaceae bacterium]
MLENTNFVEMNNNEMMETDGGCVWFVVGLVIGAIAFCAMSKKK